MTESADSRPAATPIDVGNGTLDPLPGHELPPITLDELMGFVSKPPALTGEPADKHHEAVEAALYALANGTATKQVVDKYGDIHTVRIPPDRGAIQMWLSTHRPDRWAKQPSIGDQIGKTLEALILASMSQRGQAIERSVVAEQ